MLVASVVGYIVVALMTKGAHGKCRDAEDTLAALFLSALWPMYWAVLLVAVSSKALMSLGRVTLGKVITLAYDYL